MELREQREQLLAEQQQVKVSIVECEEQIRALESRKQSLENKLWAYQGAVELCDKFLSEAGGRLPAETKPKVDLTDEKQTDKAAKV